MEFNGSINCFKENIKVAAVEQPHGLWVPSKFIGRTRENMYNNSLNRKSGELHSNYHVYPRRLA